MSSITRRRRSKGPESRVAVEDAVTDAMGRLLSHGRSFTSVSVEELAQEAGIARSTFYIHFRDKGELVRRLMKRITRELLEATDTWFAAEAPADRATLHEALRRIAGVYVRHHALMLAIVETAAYDADVAAMFADTMERLSEQTRKLVRRAQRAGLADAAVTPEMADALTWMVERCCHQLLAEKKPAQRERMIEALSHIVWTTIFGHEPGSDRDSAA